MGFGALSIKRHIRIPGMREGINMIVTEKRLDHLDEMFEGDLRKFIPVIAGHDTLMK